MPLRTDLSSIAARGIANTGFSHPIASTGAVSRRAALGLIGAAAFVAGFHVPLPGLAQAPQARPFSENAFIKIEASGDVTLIMPQVEMGQGVYTAIAMILAEELDADWTRVRLEHAPPDVKLYANPALTVQMTGNSNSVRAFWAPLRATGAAMRACLVRAAAARLGVAEGELRTDAGAVVHDGSGRKLGYGELAEEAAGLALPEHPPLKDPKDFRLIGKPLRRLDTPDKTNGRVTYGLDARPSGLSHATLAISPVRGGRVKRVDERNAMAVDGVRKVVVLDDMVAVVATNTWAAKGGLEALATEWDDGPNASLSTDQIWMRLRRAAETRDGSIAKRVGDARAELGSGDVVHAAYELPLLAHACMEPLNCTVHVRDGLVDVWIGTQVIGRVQEAVAKVCGVPQDKVTIHQHLLGGGFGRRLEEDMAERAARIAMHVEGPVKVTWSREEDMRHDRYRPAYHNAISAKLKDGRITAWRHKITGSAVVARFLPGFFANGIDIDGVDGAVDVPYAFGNLEVAFNQEEPPGIETGFWRGVGPNNNVFAIESLMDELARRAGKDPIAFRDDHLAGEPRLRAALALVREKSGWGNPLPARSGRGVAAQVAFGSFIATVVEVAIEDDGEIRLRRVTSAVDTGVAINPDSVVAQIQGGLVFGLTAGLWGEITMAAGRVEQSNFHDYRMMRMDEVPPIDVHLIPSGETPGELAKPARWPPFRRYVTRSTPRPASRCGGCQSTVRDSPRGPSDAPALQLRRTVRVPGGRGDRRHRLPADVAAAADLVRVLGRHARESRRLQGFDADRRAGIHTRRRSHHARQVPHAGGGLRGLPHRGRRRSLFRRAGVPHAVRDLVRAQHHARPGDRNRRLERCGFPQGNARWDRPRREASISDSFDGIDIEAVPSGTGCVECLATGKWWFHLRRCAQCGHIGCCDTSPNQHASAHYRETGHPIMTSFEPREIWFWDYRVDRLFKGPKLAPPRSHPAEQPVPGPEGAVPPDWTRYLNQ